MKYISISVLFLMVFMSFSCSLYSDSDSDPELKLSMRESGANALLVGVSASDENVVWASGAEGTILRSVDAGETWQSRGIPGTDSLQFRDVHAVNADTAYVLSIGTGTDSRIYKTTDGGNSWTLQFKNDITQAFFDCMAFWDSKSGIAFSDAVKGEFIIIKTTNGGKSWEQIPPEQLPPAQAGETSFAASGTCVATQGESMGWIGTGNVAQPRVLRTADRGQSWEAFPVPLDAGSAAGVASLIFRDTQHGLALGGDIAEPTTSDSSAAITTDAGTTWHLVTPPPLNSPVYGATYVPETQNVVAVGPGGVAFSSNEGTSWTHVDTVTAWGVTFANTKNGWAVGPNGTIMHMSVD